MTFLLDSTLGVESSSEETTTTAKASGLKQKIAPVMSLLISSFLLTCLICLDYYENCSMANCAQVHAQLVFFYTFDYSYLVPVINSLPIPITLTLIIPSMTLFAIILGSIVILRLKKHGLLPAILDSFQCGLFIALLYECGLSQFGPDWWTVHFSNFMVYPLSIITNEMVFQIALILLPIMLAIRLFLWRARSLASIREERNSKKKI